MLTNPAGWAIMAATAVIGLVSAYDLLTVSAKEANEAMDDAVQEYSDAKNELKNITEELEQHNKTIEELESKDKLTYAEKGQLDELKAITKELLLQQDIESRRAEKASKEAANKAVDAYEASYGDYDVSEQSVDTLLSNAGFPTPKDEYDVVGSIASLIRANELLEQSKMELNDALESGDDTEYIEEDIQGYIDDIDAATTLLDDSISDLQDKQLVLEEEYQKAIQKSLEGSPLTSSEKEIIETYDEIDRILRMIFSYTDPSQWNDTKISNIFSTEGLEKSKDELVAMAKSGELTPEVIQGYEKLHKELVDSNLILEDGQTVARAFCDEIYAIAEASKAVATSNNGISAFGISPEDAEALSEYQSKIDLISKNLGNLHNLTSSDITSLMADFREQAFVFEEFGVTGEEGVGNLEGALQTLAEKMREIALDECPQMTNAINAMFDEIINHPKGNAQKLGKEIAELENLLERVKNGESFDVAETASLIDQYGDLSDAIVKLENGYSLEEDAIVSLLNTKIKASNEAVAVDIKNTQKELENINIRIKARKAELTALYEKGRSNWSVDDQRKYGSAMTDLMVAKEEQEKVEAYLSELEKLLNELYDSGSGSSSDQTFDWIETYISRLENKISDFGDTVGDVYATWAERDAALQSQIIETEKLYDAQIEARDRYLSEANNVGLGQDWIKKIQSGTLDISKVNDKQLIEDIQEYIKWYEKAIDMDDAAADSQRSLNELRSQGFNDIQTKYDSILAGFETQANLIEAQLATAQAKGHLAVQGYYETLKELKNGEISTLEKQIADLNEEFGNSDVQEGTEAWYDLTQQIGELGVELANARKEYIDLENELRKSKWDIFDFNRENAQRVMGESDFLIDLLDGQKLINDDGGFTDAGITSVGLHGVNYNGYLEESIRYAKELQDIESQIANSPDDVELLRRRNEILELQQEMILAAEQEKEVIADLVREGYEKQKEALQELCDSYLEELELQKDIYDQQRKTADQTKRIAQLRKMIASASSGGDNSEETKAQLQKWQLELNEANNDLESDQHEQYLSEQREILNNVIEQYSDVLDTQAEDTERLFLNAMAQAKENSALVNETVNQAAKDIGYDINTGLTSLLQDDTLNTNLGDIKTRINDNGTSIADGVEQIKANNITANDIKQNTAGIGASIISAAESVNGAISGAAQSIVTAINGIDIKVPSSSSDSTSDGSFVSPSGVTYRPYSSGLVSMPEIPEYSDTFISSSMQAISAKAAEEAKKALSGNGVNNNTTNVEQVNVSFPLDNVTDAKTLLNELQKNKKLEKLITDMVASGLTGGNSFNKYLTGIR